MPTALSERLTEEFDFQYLFFEHEFPADFVNSQWQHDNEPDLFFLIYRICHLIGFLLTFCFTYRYNYLVAFGKNFLYPTNWAYLFGISNSIFGLACVLRFFLSRKVYLVHDFPWWYRCYWALHSTTLDLSFAVSLGYWSVKSFSIAVKPLGVDLYHIWNSVLMLLDLFMVSIPLRLMHVYTTIIVCVTYVAISVLYFLNIDDNQYTKLYVYPVADWRHSPATATFATVFGMVYLILLRFLIFILYLFRIWIHKTFFLVHTPESLSSLSFEEFSMSDVTSTTLTNV